MPRYLARKMADGNRFAVLCLRMENNRKFDLVQLFFEADCTLIDKKNVENIAILESKSFDHLK